MKVNNLLKRIGSVVTTAAMLATLGTTGFAYELTDGKVTGVGSDITISRVKVESTNTDNVYEVTANYKANNAQNVGVTMLTYSMARRNADSKTLDSVKINSVTNDGMVNSDMPIIGIDQNAKIAEGGEGTFKFAFTTDNSKSNKYYIAPGNTAIMFISGDNVSAKAAFSFNAPWTANKVEEVTFNTVSYTFGEPDNSIKEKVKAELDDHTSVIVKNSTNGSLSTTATAAYSNIVLDTANNKATASVAYSKAMAPEAILGVTSGSVEVALAGQKDTWTATNATVGKDNKISVAEGADEAAIIAAIKASSIVLGDGSRQYTLSETEKKALTIEKVNDTTYRVAFAASYDGDTQIVTATGLTVDVTVNFTENNAKEISLVTKGDDGEYTDYTWNKDNVSVKSDADDAKIKDVVKNKLAEGNVYAKITYTNPSISNGADQYKYVKVAELVDATSTTVDKTNKKVTVILPDGDIFFPTDGENKVEKTLEFGYTVINVYKANDITVEGTTDYQKATADENPTVGVKALLDKLTFKVDGKEIPAEKIAWTYPELQANSDSYNATVTIGNITETDSELYEKWPTDNDGKLTKEVTGKITVKPAGPFAADSAEVKSLTRTIGAEDAAIDKVKAALGQEVTVKDETGTKTAVATVGEWTCENYNANKPGTYTFKAPVTGVDATKVTLPANGLEATATVTLSPIEKTSEIATKNVSVRPQTEDGTANAKLFAAIGSQTINFGEGALADSVEITDLTGATVAWDGTGNLTQEGSTATVTYKFTADTKSNGELYIIKSGATVKFTVTVRNSVESNKAWELGNTGEYNAGTVKVYLPAGTTASETAPVEVVAKMYKTESDTTELATATATLKAAAESVDLTFDKSFNAVNIHANDSYIVKVTVNNTPLTYTVGEGETATSKDFVQGTVYATSSRRPSTGGSTTPEVKSYNVSVKADNNGKATVNKTKATAGETVAVNVEPNEGYKVKEITVKDVNGKSIDVDQKTRTFEMPAGAVTVTVTFEEGTEEPTPDDKGKFKDVPDSFWAAADIYTLREAGIIDGKTADIFDPDGQVTRAEFTKMIVKMFGVEAKDTKVEFADCGEDDWFTPFVAAAVEAGYVKGYSDTEFAPDKVISREEACAILGRAYAKTANSELSFTDKDSIDEYAQPYVALLVEMGFINGYEDGTFRAQNQITRAEAAKIIGCAYRLATASK